MQKSRAKYELCAFFGAIALVALFAGPAGAKRDFLERYQAYFGLKETGKCIFCHNVKENEKPKKENLGLYGKDVQDMMKSKDEYRINVQFAAVALFDKDSDSDGATNMEEMALNTYPGDPKSTPTKDALDAYRKRVAEQKAARAAKEGAGAGSQPPPDKSKQPPKKKQ